MWGSSSENSDDDDNFYIRSQNDSTYDLPKPTEELDSKTPADILSASLLTALDKNPLQATVADQIRTSEDYNVFMFSQSQQSQKGQNAGTTENTLTVDRKSSKKKKKKHGHIENMNDPIALDRNPLQVTVPDQIKTSENYNDFVFSQFQQSQKDDATIKKNKEYSSAENSKKKVPDYSSSILESSDAKNDLTNQLFSQFRNMVAANNSCPEVVSQTESILTIDTLKLTQMSTHLDELQYAQENNEKNDLKNKSNTNLMSEFSMEDIDKIVDTTLTGFGDKVVKSKSKSKRKSKSSDKMHKKKNNIVVESWIQQIEGADSTKDNFNHVEDRLDRSVMSDINSGNKEVNIEKKENVDEIFNGQKKKHKKSNKGKENGKQKKGNKSDSTRRQNKIKSIAVLDGSGSEAEIEKQIQNETVVRDIKTNTTVSKMDDEAITSPLKSVRNSPSPGKKSKKSKKLSSMSQTESVDVEEENLDGNEEPDKKNNKKRKKRDHSKEECFHDSVKRKSTSKSKPTISTCSEEKEVEDHKIKSKHSHDELDNSYIDSETVDEVVTPTKKRKILLDSTEIIMSLEEKVENVHKKCKKSKKNKSKDKETDASEKCVEKSKKKKRKLEICDSNLNPCNKKPKVVTKEDVSMDSKTKLNITSAKNIKSIDKSSNVKSDSENKGNEDKTKQSKSKLKEKSEKVSRMFVDSSFDSDNQANNLRISEMDKKGGTEEMKINGQNLDELINSIINEGCSQIAVSTELLDSSQISAKESLKSKKGKKDKKDKKEKKGKLEKKHKKHNKEENMKKSDCLSKTNEEETTEEAKSVQDEKENDETEHSMKQKSKKSKKSKKEKKAKSKSHKLFNESENINKNIIHNEESNIAHCSNSKEHHLEIEVKQEYEVDEFLDEMIPSLTNYAMNESTNSCQFSQHTFSPIPKETKCVDREYELTAEDEEILRYLTFYINFEIHPLHKFERNVSSSPAKEIKAQIKESGLEYNRRTYNPDESNIILNNWHHFCKKHRIPQKPELFMNLSCKGADNKLLISKKNAIIFTQWLARGLPNRLLFSVYRKFKNLFRFYKRGKFTPEEDKIILETISSSKKKRGIFTRLALLLDRDPTAVEKHCITLRENKKHGFKVERIGINEAANIVKTLMEVLGCQDVGELKNNNNIPINKFAEVGERLHVQALKIQQYWYNNLHPKLFVTGTRSMLQVKIQLLKLILANPEFRNLHHVDYNKLLPEMDGWTPIALGKLLRNILNWNSKIQEGQDFKEQLQICLADISRSPERRQLEVARFENGELYFDEP